MKVPSNLRPRFIKGFEKLYGIAREGLVYSFQSGKFLTHIENSRGYLQVKLCKDGQVIPYLVHRLVAETYIPIPTNLKHIPVEKLTVDHINNNKKDNRVQNLQWLTRGDNFRKANKKPVAMNNIPLIFSSQAEAAQFIYENNKRATYISQHIKGNLYHKTCKGHTLHTCTQEELEILNEFKN